MNPDSRNVTDYTNNNTIFMVWNFKGDFEVRAVFNKVCKLVINLNNSANVRFPVSRASCVMGIGYDAWLRLQLPVPLPKELANFIPVAGAKHIAVSSKGDLHFHIRADNTSICYDMACQKPLDQNLKAFDLKYSVIYFDSVNKIAANLSGIDINGVWLLGNEYSLLI